MKLNRTLCFLLIVLVCVISLLAVRRQFDHDEFEALHSGWKILDGEKIYEDFFQHHHPFYYYVVALVIKIFGETTTSIIAMRMLSLLMTGGMGFITWKFAITIFKDRQIALISVFLLLSSMIFIDSAIEIRPDVPQTFLGLLSIWLLFKYFKTKHIMNLALSAVFLGISFLFLQKAVFTGLIIGLLLLANACKKHIPWRSIVVYGVVGTVTILPYYIYLVATGGLDSYITFNWLINMRFLNRFSAFNGLGVILRGSTLLAVFYVVGLIRFTKTTNEVRIGWMSLGLLASNFLVRAPYNQYFMIAIPFMAVIAARSIHAVLETQGRGLSLAMIVAGVIAFFYVFRDIQPEYVMMAIPLIVVLAVAVFVGLNKTADKKHQLLAGVLTVSLIIPMVAILNRAGKDNAAQIGVVEYVTSITSSEDHVYDGDVSFNLFRKDIDYFWFSVRQDGPRYGALVTYQNMVEYHYDIYESIDKYKPKVIRPYLIDKMDDLRIAEHYTESQDCHGFYIRAD